MTLVKSDQDTLLNVREGVQILQQRMRFQRWCLVTMYSWVTGWMEGHDMVMRKASFMGEV